MIVWFPDGDGSAKYEGPSATRETILFFVVVIAALLGLVELNLFFSSRDDWTDFPSGIYTTGFGATVCPII